MPKFTHIFTIIMLSPLVASAQDAFFPSYSAEVTVGNDQPVYHSAPGIMPQQDANMNIPLKQSPQPPVSPYHVFTAPAQTAVQNSPLNPRAKPEYIPPIPTSIVVSPAGGYPGDVYLGYWQPGHYRQLTGSPYFYSAPNAGPRGPLAGNANPPSYVSYDNSYSVYSTSGSHVANNQAYNNSYAYSNSYGVAVNSGAGGIGRAVAGGDPYSYHFGPGFYRSGEYGHYRFPYYSYRRPWYHPGFAGYNRDTNLPW